MSDCAFSAYFDSFVALFVMTTHIVHIALLFSTLNLAAILSSISAASIEVMSCIHLRLDKGT